jgi:hypothetical protein
MLDPLFLVVAAEERHAEYRKQAEIEHLTKVERALKTQQADLLERFGDLLIMIGMQLRARSNAHVRHPSI